MITTAATTLLNPNKMVCLTIFGMIGIFRNRVLYVWCVRTHPDTCTVSGTFLFIKGTDRGIFVGILYERSSHLTTNVIHELAFRAKFSATRFECYILGGRRSCIEMLMEPLVRRRKQRSRLPVS